MKWRILLVDDEPDVRLIVRTTLQDKYEIVEAHDGLDALEKVERFEPDFIVMDVMMPLMDGFEACLAIRRTPAFKDIPVMFLSALGKKEDIKKGYSSGANLYLTKPFDPPRLLKNIDVFFETTPPARKNKTYTIEQIHEAERTGRLPSSPGMKKYEPAPPPAPAVARPEPHIPEAMPVPEGVLPRVLVVDDDREMCSLIRLTLMDLYEVVFANDGMEAIERLVKYQPDILIIDVMLPKMNGYQLCQSMRSNRAFSRIPIMMCSAKGSEKDINLAKRIGANEYIVKPFSGSDMLRKVESLKSIPGFRVRPKSYTLEQIMQMERPAEEVDVFNADEDIHRSSRSGTNRSIGKFLAKEGKKDATERDDAPEKKKRRMFGLGGG